MRIEKIGDATLYLGDCMDILPTLDKVDAVITDPPYSETLHKNHNLNAERKKPDKVNRQKLNYDFLSENKVFELADVYSKICKGWIVWMSDSSLTPIIQTALQKNNRYVFQPLPFYQAGRSVRLAGDGPCSWTDWITVARTKAQSKWGTLPGGYIAGQGWNDKERMGGKPTFLMDALVCDYSRINDVVLDSHMGAGTTGVACIKNGRKFIGMEIDGQAFDIACRRIEQAYKQGQLFEHEPIKQIQSDLL